LTIDGVLETDAAYMARVVAELFGQSSSLVAVRQTFEKYGLTNFQLLNSKEDPTHWNLKSAPDSVNLYLSEEDYDRIPFMNQVFINVSLAGMRMFVLCPAQNHDCYGLNYGNGTDADDYIIPPPFIPGAGIEGQGYGASYGAFYGD
jgi:hypothetical protein